MVGFHYKIGGWTMSEKTIVSVNHTTSSELHTVGYVFMLRGIMNELIHVFIRMLVTKNIRMLT